MVLRLESKAGEGRMVSIVSSSIWFAAEMDIVISGCCDDEVLFLSQYFTRSGPTYP